MNSIDDFRIFTDTSKSTSPGDDVETGVEDVTRRVETRLVPVENGQEFPSRTTRETDLKDRGL